HFVMRHRKAANLRRDQALGPDQRGERTRREGASAKSENVNLVTRLPIPAQEAVEFTDIRWHADAGGAIEQSEGPPAGSTDAFDVVSDLVRFGVVDRLIKAPHIGFLGGKGVTRSVCEQHIFSRQS